MKLRSMTALALMAGGLFGYYPWLRYNTRTAPFTGVPSKFDLAQLPGKTVYFYISEAGPQTLLPGDSPAALYSQIRAAARVWNDVDTSDIRIAYGGVRPAGFVAGNTPSIDVSFEDLPPGVLSQGGPVVVDDDGPGAPQAFLPILRSTVEFPRNFAALPSPCPCPSWSEYFFTTAVHEFGHALGLQHSFTGGVMSQIVTRGTTKAKPLAADDAAGLSFLYPTRAFAANFGSIAGRVTAGGAPVAYASVVAISSSGAAVSSLTHPDGTYRIDGIPPGTYLVYTHQLPPGADIIQAQDIDRRPVALSPQFENLFFPSSRTANGASPLQVGRGSFLDNINLNVTNRRTSISIHNVFTLGFPGQVAVHPGQINVPGPENRNFVIATGPGLMVNGQPAPGLSVSVLGGTASVTGVSRYDASYIRIDLANIVPNDGPNHLVFSTANDLFVLPAAFNVGQRPAPQISSAVISGPANARALTVTGSGLTPDTRILVDGATVPVRSFEDGPQRMTLALPPAPFAHRAALVAANADGQSSLFLQPPTVLVYDEGNPATPPAAIAAVTQNGTLPAGVEAMVEISGVNTNFPEGNIALGVNSTDVVVRRAWVTAPNRILANVWVSPLAVPGSFGLSIFSGLATIGAVNGLQVTPANARQIALGAAAGSSGAIVQIPVVNLPNGTPLSLVVGDRTATVLGSTGGALQVQLPAGMIPGPAIARLQAGGESSLPIVVNVEQAPPQILAAALPGNLPVDTGRPARPGDTLRLLVAGLGDHVPVNRLLIVAGGVEHFASAAIPAAGGTAHEVVFTLSAQIPAGQVPLTLALDARQSAAFTLSVVR